MRRFGRAIRRQCRGDPRPHRADRLLQLIGSELDELGPGFCTASVARRPELLQYLGMFHQRRHRLSGRSDTSAATTSVRPGRSTRGAADQPLAVAGAIRLSLYSAVSTDWRA